MRREPEYRSVALAARKGMRVGGVIGRPRTRWRGASVEDAIMNARSGSQFGSNIRFTRARRLHGSALHCLGILSAESRRAGADRRLPPSDLERRRYPQSNESIERQWRPPRSFHASQPEDA
jgi:hypothetical protein